VPASNAKLPVPSENAALLAVAVTVSLEPTEPASALAVTLHLPNASVVQLVGARLPPADTLALTDAPDTGLPVTDASKVTSIVCVS